MTSTDLVAYTYIAERVEEAILDVLADFEPLAIWEVCLIVGMATADVYDGYTHGSETTEDPTP